jgi:hypothetical protein
MSCNPKPEVTCGDLIPDTCIPITGNILPFCDPDKGCYRQSDFNEAAATQFCAIIASIGTIGECPGNTGASGILGSIYLGCLTDCEVFTFPVFPIEVPEPVKSTVSEEFQQVYGELCKIEGVLNDVGKIPISTLSGLEVPACIVDPCGIPLTTITDLLNAMMAKIEACCCQVG